MGSFGLLHMIVVTIVALIPFAVAVAAFVLLVRIARDVHLIRKLIQGRNEKP